MNTSARHSRRELASGAGKRNVVICVMSLSAVRKRGWMRPRRCHRSGTAPAPLPHTEHSQLPCASSAGVTSPISLSKEVISPKYLLLNFLRLFPSFFPISSKHPQLRGPTAALGLSYTGIWALIHPFGMQQKGCTIHVVPTEPVATGGSAM